MNVRRAVGLTDEGLVTALGEGRGVHGAVDGKRIRHDLRDEDDETRARSTGERHAGGKRGARALDAGGDDVDDRLRSHGGDPFHQFSIGTAA